MNIRPGSDSFDKKNDSSDTVIHGSPEKLCLSTSPRIAKAKGADSTSDSDRTLEAEASSTENEPAFLSQLMAIFWALHKARPSNVFLTPVGQPGKAFYKNLID